VRVEITTARNVDEDEMRSIETKLSAKLQGELVFSWREDSSILGGIIVQYGGKVLDGSLKRRVTAIERQVLG
jgi:F-type H+-transporting ATPase subunit delta